MGLDMGQKNRHALLYYCRYNVLSKRSLLQLAPSGLVYFWPIFPRFLLWWPTSTMMSLADFCASYASTVLTPPKEQTYFGTWKAGGFYSYSNCLNVLWRQ